MTDDSKGGSNEPSMEEILASIRRIIAEDAEQEEASASGAPTPQRDDAPPEGSAAHWPEDREAQADPPPRPERTPLPEDEDEAPLELTRLVNEDGSITDLSVGAGPAMPFVADDASEREEAREEERCEEPQPLVQAHHEPEDGEETAERFEDIEVEDAVLDDVAAAVPPVSEAKLEADSESEIRAWLDRNLPDIVERVVREEVEKMLRRLKDG